MTDIRAAAKRWQKDINNVLNRHWAPIPDAPDDEYVVYSSGLAGLIGRRATDDELLKYLEWAELENIGLCRPDACRCT